VNFKIPRSVLVVIHTPQLEILLIERADGVGWQSVTGSLESEFEGFEEAAIREVREETGIDALDSGHNLVPTGTTNHFEIYSRYLHRYPPGTTSNEERGFSLCVPTAMEVQLNPQEHSNWAWHHWTVAAELVFSKTNREEILRLAQAF